MSSDQSKEELITTKKLPKHQDHDKNPIEQETTPPQPSALQPPYISSSSLYVPIGASTSGFEQQFETLNTKRPRYTTTPVVSQWKLLPSSSLNLATESTPSPKPHTTTTTTTTASSSDTTSSPSQSPINTTQHVETTKPETEHQQQQLQHHHHQFRKGKYVSPVWKPNEMLWLAKAWRVQYQGGGESSPTTQIITGETTTVQSSRGKTRAEKDREVAEFLSRHRVNRDAKTAGTKWDNMLGEFRKVYEWERGGERDQLGKSYFRLSPYERKVHRLPASFDEEVFEELAQFMGSRIRSSSQSRVPSLVISPSGDDSSRPLRALPPPPPFKDEDFSGRGKQLGITSARGSLIGFETSVDVTPTAAPPSPSLSSKELRRIGKIKMTWEESVSLWGEEGDNRRGRVRIGGSSFLNADELTFLDDSMVACSMEAFEDGPLKGFSVDKFVNGQQVKIFGRRMAKSILSIPRLVTSTGFIDRIPHPLMEPATRFGSWEFQDPSEYYLGCLRGQSTMLPNLFELSWYLQEPPQEELRFPLRRDVYRDLPQGKELFFTISTDHLLDCRGFAHDILSSIVRTNPNISASSRDSFIGLWDDCINRVVSKFCSVEMVFVRKPSSSSLTDTLQDQWPNVTGFLRNLCLWRGEETDSLREGLSDPSSSIVEKLLWTFGDLPYVLGYYAVGYLVTFCALCRSEDRIIRTDLYSLDLSSPSERIKVLVPCYRIAVLLPLLADRCTKQLAFNDFERFDVGNGIITEMTPNTATRFFSSRRKWGAVKETYALLDRRIPHAEFIYRSSEKDLALVFKPRGVKQKPTDCEQLVEALKYVAKALVALHDLCFMHRDLSWEKVMRRIDNENEWFVSGFDEAVTAPQLYPYVVGGELGRGRHAPEMGRGLHGVKVDVYGIGELVKTFMEGQSQSQSQNHGGGVVVPKMLIELQNRCLEQNPEQRPTAADCYRQLLQVQSSLHSSSSAGGSDAY